MIRLFRSDPRSIDRATSGAQKSLDRFTGIIFDAGYAVAPTSVFGVIFMVQPTGMFTPRPFSR